MTQWQALYLLVITDAGEDSKKSVGLLDKYWFHTTYWRRQTKSLISRDVVLHMVTGPKPRAVTAVCNCSAVSLVYYCIVLSVFPQPVNLSVEIIEPFIYTTLRLIKRTIWFDFVNNHVYTPYGLLLFTLYRSLINRRGHPLCSYDIGQISNIDALVWHNIYNPDRFYFQDTLGKGYELEICVMTWTWV